MTEQSLLARDLMTKEMVMVPADMPVTSLAQLLAEQSISAVPVTDAQGGLLGLVTEADLLRRLAGREDPTVGFLAGLFSNTDARAARYARTHGCEARDIMTTELVTVGPDTTAAHCASLMEKHRIKRLPVLQDGKLAGIVSRSDLLKAVLEPPAKIGTPGEQEDARIRTALKAEMRAQPWVPELYVFAEVAAGVVTLHGFVKSDEVRRGLRVLASRIEGVRQVEDKLTEFPYARFGAMI
jgi:CBS domain-containing protein